MEQKKVYSIPGLCLSGSLDKVECCKTTETYQKKGGKGSLAGRSGAHRWGQSGVNPHSCGSGTSSPFLVGAFFLLLGTASSAFGSVMVQVSWATGEIRF